MFLTDMLSFLVLFPSALLCLFPMKNQLKHSLPRTLWRVSALLLLCCALMAFLQTRFGLPDNIFLVPLFLLSFTVYHLSLKVSVWKSLAVFCSSVALMAGLENLTLCACTLIHLRLGVNMKPPHMDLLQLGLSVSITLLLARLYLTHGSLVIDHSDHPHSWCTLMLFSAVIFAIDMLLLPLIEKPIEDAGDCLLMLFTSLLLLALWWLMQQLFYYSVSGHLARIRAEERNRFLEAQERQFVSQQHYMKTTEKTRHDFRHSIRTLAELYDSGDLDALGNYLHTYMQAMPVNEVVNYCGNPAVNALLNFYTHVASQNQIALTLRISLPEQLPVSDVDLCNMLGNILENAVLACQKTSNRFIQLTVQEENHSQLYIVAVNSFDGKVRQKDSRYLSTNRSGNGLGLSSVTSTAESYGGTAQFEHDEKCFYSSIAIPL